MTGDGRPRLVFDSAIPCICFHAESTRQEPPAWPEIVLVMEIPGAEQLKSAKPSDDGL